ncbi:energy transducer TonB [Acinetobacter piscicola]|uniref:Protein TonB n=2 Tax=Moraxellaceae TaxID=468 RepID=A0A7S6VZW8_9GAMM|nr:energy transducer TonB [Acinetobacter piscicola]
MQAPNPMKKKVIAAVIAVLVGHMGALWALSHLKTPELKPIEKKPIQVKFVKIKEEQVIPPPPPPPPVKPKVEPKPVVEKKAPPPPVEKPKLITQKKPVVEKKAIQQEEPKIDQEKIKREQEQRQQEQQRQEQQRLEQQRQEQQRQEQQRQDQLRQQQEQQRQEQLRQQQEQQRRQQEAQQPRKLSAGEISWKKAPAFDFDDDLLKNQSRSLLVRIEINPAGKITNVTVLKSSGLPSLDREVRSAVRFARMNPSSDGRAMIADLPVSLKTSGQ